MNLTTYRVMLPDGAEEAFVNEVARILCVDFSLRPKQCKQQISASWRTRSRRQASQ